MSQWSDFKPKQLQDKQAELRNVSLKSQYPSENVCLPWNPFSGICEVFGAASSHLKTNTRWNMLLMKQTNQLLWILVYVPEMPNVGNIYHVCYSYIIPRKDQHLPSWYHLREHPALPVTKTYRTAAVTRISNMPTFKTQLWLMSGRMCPRDSPTISQGNTQMTYEVWGSKVAICAYSSPNFDRVKTSCIFSLPSHQYWNRQWFVESCGTPPKVPICK